MTYKCKLVKLNLFGDSLGTFSETCKTLATFKLEENSIRNKSVPKVGLVNDVKQASRCISLVTHKHYFHCLDRSRLSLDVRVQRQH